MVNARCKDCIKAYQQENHPKMLEAAYRWRDSNLDKAQEANEQWRQKRKEHIKEYRKNYNLKNPEKVKQARDNWRINNSARDKENRANWAKANPMKIAEMWHNRRSRLKFNGGTYTEKEWISLCTYYDFHCLSCLKKKPLTVDHVIPLSKGGVNVIENIQPLCKNCNSRKQNKMIDFRPLFFTRLQLELSGILL